MRPVVLQMGVTLDWFVHGPVVIGNGAGLFGPLREPLRLDLVEARTFPSGTVIHTYRPHEEAR